ncbi:MAG: carbohydrate binding family 9 domain-containing protein [Armatimonadota bacterium]
MSFKCCFILLLVLLSSCLAYAENVRPIIPGYQVTEAPVIDGDISDPCWKDAPAVDDFYLPADGSKAEEPAIVKICYDEKNIYVAFHCFDSHPEGIVAKESKRGADIANDDWFGFDIDSWNTCERISVFNASVAGGQIDSLESGQVSNIKWRGDWSVASKIVSDGYTSEVCVPFAVLKFKSGQRSMGIAFNRRNARIDKFWRAPSLGPRHDMRRFYIWDGLNLHAQSNNRPIIMAYSLMGVGTDHIPESVGLDMKYAVTPNITANMALNPDFSSVEQEVNGTDFTYSERYLSDARPFFQEGSGYLPGSELFYTRRIEEMDYAAKVTGKASGIDIGAMYGRSSDADDFTSLRLARSWTGKGSVSLSAVNNSASGLDSYALNGGASYVLSERGTQRLTLSMASSMTDAALGVPTQRRAEYGLKYNGTPRKLCWSVAKQRIDPQYNPSLGYVPEKDLDAWRFSAYVWDSPSQGKSSYWSVEAGCDLVKHLDGSPYYNSLALWGSHTWRSGQSVSLSLSGSDRPPYKDMLTSCSYTWGIRKPYCRGTVGVTFGDRAGGNYLSYAASQGWAINNKLVIAVGFDHSRISEPSPNAYSLGQAAVSVMYFMDDDQSIIGRFASRSAGDNLYLAYRRRVRMGLDAFIGYGDPNAIDTKNRLTMKLVRAF